MSVGKTLNPTGSWVAVITPFTPDDKVDIKGFEKLVDFHVANGTDGLIFMGSTGESTSLSMEEKKEIISAMVDYCKGKIPAIFGVTCSTTRDTIKLAEFAEAQGADGIMLTVPSYLIPPQDALYEYFSEVARSVSISVTLYNNPGRVVANIQPDTIARLAEIPNIVADKEAVPSVSHITDVLRKVNGRINVLCCDSPKFDLIMPLLAMGGHGTANVAGNIIPREMAELSRPWKGWDDVVKARELFFEYKRVMEVLYSVINPVPVKAAVGLLGLPAGNPRPPLQPMKGEKLEILKKLLEDLKLREKYGL
ncbi:MAG: 4-hydroxy-tetrahydrodipicolinate synthase [Synergistetes bacterium]|nr:4-hydroxy-tetrahydrodipicolinate synthase [Synergistota bacterium]